MKNLLPAILLLLLVKPLAAQERNKEKLKLTLESIWNGYFDEKNLRPHIMHTRPAIAFIRAEKETNFEGILTLDMVTGKIIDTIFTNQTKVQEGETPTTFTFFEDFTFAPDDSKILIKTEKQGVYHLSVKEFTFIWDRAKKTLKPVSTDGKISYATFSPDSKSLAYIRDANLYVRDLATDQTTVVTADGAFNQILNGMADGMYEDGFGITKAFEWSPDGSRIAFMKINQSFVKAFPITIYDKNYPTVFKQVYSKAGEAISEASVYIYDFKSKTFSKADAGANPNQYITGFKWQPNGQHLFLQKLNRPQQLMEIVKINATNGSEAGVVYSERNDTSVRIYPNNMFMLKKSNSFLLLSEKSGYTHIYEINYDTKTERPVTKGEWEVLGIEAVHDSTQKIFYTGTQRSPTQRHLYSVTFDGKKYDRLTDDRGWHEVWLSYDYKYFFDRSTTINAPSQFKIFTTGGREVSNKAIIENKKFKETLEKYAYRDASMFSFRNQTGDNINGWVIKPVAGTKKAPLLLYVYGGHTKQEVTDEWNDRMAMTFRYFSAMGYLVACIDPMGTPGQGAAFRKAPFKKPSELEVKDIIEAKNYLLRNYDIDENRTAIMGWSYGGYLAAMTGIRHSGAFNKAIAIAPVTNWREYANVYTERILQLPSENPEGYKKATPEEYVTSYNGGLLLVHGSSDDNVHVQHSMELARALTDSDHDYDIQIYPDKNHNLSDGAQDRTRMNLFKRILKFLERKNG
jgi:dipeptidyl-peptidase 4